MMILSIRNYFFLWLNIICLHQATMEYNQYTLVSVPTTGGLWQKLHPA